MKTESERDIQRSKESRELCQNFQELNQNTKVVPNEVSFDASKIWKISRKKIEQS